MEKIMSIDLSKFWLGLDMPTLPSYTDAAYPRYNLIEKAGDYRIEVAVPGWKKEELEIIFDNKELHIKGKKDTKLGDDEDFIHVSEYKLELVKKYIDNIAFMRNVSYDGLNNVPDILLKNLFNLIF